MASNLVTDAVDAYLDGKKMNLGFHESLTTVIEKLSTTNKKNKIIIFVDEIDRCRPTFAIELLERIKHLFNVPNVIFVLSLDKQQLNVSLGALYGERINSDEYLRRFIDLEFLLPKANTVAFTKYLYDSFNFDNFFLERKNNDFSYDKDNLIQLFNLLSDLLNLSLRAREQCFTRIKVGMMTTPINLYFYPMLLVTLVMLKTANPEIYKKFISTDGTAKDVLDYFRSVLGGNSFLESHSGTVVESYLIAVKTDRHTGNNSELDRYTDMLNNPDIDYDLKKRPQKIVSIIQGMHQKDAVPSLDYVINKIDLITLFNKM